MEIAKIAEQLDEILDALLHVKAKSEEQQDRFARIVLARCEIEKTAIGSNVCVKMHTQTDYSSI